MSHSSITPSPNTDGDTTGETFETRERAHDKEDPHGVLVVLETHQRRADRFELTDGVTVAGVNQDYPASDHVVLCVYERALDKLWPDWRDVPPSSLRHRYRIEHDQTPPGIRALPASRLERYEAGNWTEVDGRIVCENCAEWHDTMIEWVEHVARDCL